MIDGFGRTIDYLRISVTDRCNLRCVYCMKEEQQFFQRRTADAGRMGQTFAKAPLWQASAKSASRRQTLMRQDIVELVEAISNIPGIEKVVMTSNAVHLAPLAEKLKKAGLSTVSM